MAEPLGTASTPSDTAPPPDPGLQEAAQGLADQIDGQGGGGSPEPAEAPPAPTAALAVAPPAREPVRFAEGVRKFQSGYRGRIERERAENRRLRGLEERFTQARERDNELLRAAAEALKGHGATAPEEKPPDPVTEPDAFLAWWQAKQEGVIKEQLKPVVEFAQRQEERLAQLEQTRAAQQEEQERHQAATQQFLAWEREYLQESPAEAAGVRERYTTLRDAFASAMEYAGVEPEHRQGLAERHLFAIAAGADQVGDNGVAAMDGFAYGLYRTFYDLVRQDLAQDGIQIPAFDGEEPAPAPAPVAAAYPGPNGNGGAPQVSEAERLAAVRQRTATVASAAPRAPDRGTGAAPSKAIQLLQSGVTDAKRLYAACLEEANGRASVADQFMAELIDQIPVA